MTATVEKTMEECTHNCMNCGVGCEEKDLSDTMTLEKALYTIGDIDSDALLSALQEF